MVKHKVGDLVYYKNIRGFSNVKEPSIGVITKCDFTYDTYHIDWFNENFDLKTSEFSSLIISWFKRDLEEAIENGEVSP